MVVLEPVPVTQGKKQEWDEMPLNHILYREIIVLRNFLTILIICQFQPTSQLSSIAWQLSNRDREG